MAIAIRPIPVLTGATAERFEDMLECSSKSARTMIPENLRRSIRSMQERSKNVVIKMPKN